MPANKALRNVAGVMTEFFGATTGGVGDADKFPALDAAGRLALAMMPPGIGPDVNIVTASEALAANDAVNVWTGGARKADATVAGKRANGFVLAAVSITAPATIYAEGTVTGMTGLTLGADVWLTAVAGVVTTTKPVAAGNIEQRVGVAMSTTTFNFDIGTPITLA